MTELPHVTVVWGDAYSQDATRYISFADARKWHKPMASHTTGWLMIRDLHGVTIAGERQIDPNTGQYLYRGHTFIPSGMILKIKHAKISSGRKADHSAKKPRKLVKEKSILGKIVHVEDLSSDLKVIASDEIAGEIGRKT